jgi:hypothetical protein
VAELANEAPWFKSWGDRNIISSCMVNNIGRVFKYSERIGSQRNTNFVAHLENLIYIQQHIFNWHSSLMQYEISTVLF